MAEPSLPADVTEVPAPLSPPGAGLQPCTVPVGRAAISYFFLATVRLPTRLSRPLHADWSPGARARSESPPGGALFRRSGLGRGGPSFCSKTHV